MWYHRPKQLKRYFALWYERQTITWWRHQKETFSALQAICAGNSPVTGEFPTQRPVTQSFDVFFDLRLHERLSKQLWGWWLQTPLRPFWCHSNDQIAVLQWSEKKPIKICLLCHCSCWPSESISLLLASTGMVAWSSRNFVVSISGAVFINGD